MSGHVDPESSRSCGALAGAPQLEARGLCRCLQRRPSSNSPPAPAARPTMHSSQTARHNAQAHGQPEPHQFHAGSFRAGSFMQAAFTAGCRGPTSARQSGGLW